MAQFNLRVQKYHDGSIFGLRLYMFFFWFKYQNKRFFESYLLAFNRSKEKKNIFKIFFELIFLTWKWKCLPYHYFRYALYEKKYDRNKILNYLPETVFYYKILPLLNKQMFLLDNKNIFETIIKNYGLKYPNTLVKIVKNVFFDENLKQITNEDDLQKILVNSQTDAIFCKPADCGSGGEDILFLKRKGKFFVDKDGVIFDFLYLQKLAVNDWIIQELVENCEVLKNIYKYSTNTFRVLTYFQPHKGTKVLYCILKFGNNKAFTDNAHSGGLYVGVNLQTGVLDDVAYDENLFTYKSHPESGVVFSGQKIKEISEIVRLAEKLGNIFPSLSFVGWDIALTQDGPVVIEGNSSPGLTIIQRTNCGMREFISLVRDTGFVK